MFYVLVRLSAGSLEYVGTIEKCGNTLVWDFVYNLRFALKFDHTTAKVIKDLLPNSDDLVIISSEMINYRETLLLALDSFTSDVQFKSGYYPESFHVLRTAINDLVNLGAMIG